MVTGKLVRGKCIWGLMLVAILVCGRAPAQVITGEITGTIVDTSGAVVPDATVSLVNEGTGAVRKDTTGNSGSFVFNAVPYGNYTVKVEKAGFRTLERTGNVLSAQQRLTLGNLELAVGQVTQTMEVKAAGELVNMESAASDP